MNHTLERWGYGEEEIIAVFILRLVFRSGRDKEEMYPEHREEDTQRGQLLKVSYGDAASPAAWNTILLNLGADHHDHVDEHQEVDNHDDDYWDPDKPGAVAEVHPAVVVHVDEAEERVGKDSQARETPAKATQQPQASVVIVKRTCWCGQQLGHTEGTGYRGTLWWPMWGKARRECGRHHRVLTHSSFVQYTVMWLLLYPL